MWRVVFTRQAAKDARRLKKAGLDGKAKALVDVVAEDPFATPPACERLVGSPSGLYSRRISRQQRFVYEVIEGSVEADGTHWEGTIKVLRMWTRYEDVR